MRRDRAILVLGPTASGKSSLALALARRLAGAAEIVSADSMQVYRGMDIGTAKPTTAERAEVPHHLLDIADPHEAGFSVEEWRTLALRAIAEITSRGSCAIVVGGTNLYVQALLMGLFDGPPSNEALREELARVESAELHARLARLDPESAARLHVNDRRRVTRAIEVLATTGIPLSAHQTQWSAGPPSLPDGWRCVGLLPSAPSNARTINARVKRMVECGFLAEVRELLRAGPLGRQAAEAVGYRELTQHLTGQATLEGAIEAMKMRTRRLARQQRTWLRRFEHIPGSRWFHADADAFEPERTGVEFLAAE